VGIVDNVFFPQTHRPGKEAEVDFGEVTINMRSEPVTCMLFALRRRDRRRRLNLSNQHRRHRRQPQTNRPPGMPQHADIGRSERLRERPTSGR
jgi:hypothetical protein